MRKRRGPVGAIIITILIVGFCIFGYFKWFFVFSDGVKTGQLRSVHETGVLFKTYECKMMLPGYGNNPNSSGTVQSNEFKFSAINKEVYQQLLSLSGYTVTVHYKEYFGTLPWRGYERSIVDSVELTDGSHQDTYSSGEEFIL